MISSHLPRHCVWIVHGIRISDDENCHWRWPNNHRIPLCLLKVMFLLWTKHEKWVVPFPSFPMASPAIKFLWTFVSFSLQSELILRESSQDSPRSLQNPKSKQSNKAQSSSFQTQEKCPPDVYMRKYMAPTCLNRRPYNNTQDLRCDRSISVGWTPTVKSAHLLLAVVGLRDPSAVETCLLLSLTRAEIHSRNASVSTSAMNHNVNSLRPLLPFLKYQAERAAADIEHTKRQRQLAAEIYTETCIPP